MDGWIWVGWGEQGCDRLGNKLALTELWQEDINRDAIEQKVTIFTILQDYETQRNLSKLEKNLTESITHHAARVKIAKIHEVLSQKKR
jgi:hypothetical protein